MQVTEAFHQSLHILSNHHPVVRRQIRHVGSLDILDNMTRVRTGVFDQIALYVAEVVSGHRRLVARQHDCSLPGPFTPTLDQTPEWMVRNSDVQPGHIHSG